MKQEQLHTLLEDALGMIDDDLLQSVDQLRQQRDSHLSSAKPFAPQDPAASSAKTSNILKSDPITKNILRREVFKWAGLAACFCLFIGIGLLWTLGGNTTADLAYEAENLYSENIKDTPLEMEDVSNLSDANGSTTPETLPATGYVLPSLSLLTSQNEFLIPHGTHSWHWTMPNGFITGVEGDSYHPLQLQGSLPVIQTSEATVSMKFDDLYGAPDQIKIECWSEEHWNDVLAEPITLSPDGNIVPLIEGGYIYQITAHWANGTVRYDFYVCYTSE